MPADLLGPNLHPLSGVVWGTSAAIRSLHTHGSWPPSAAATLAFSGTEEELQNIWQVMGTARL